MPWASSPLSDMMSCESLLIDKGMMDELKEVKKVLNPIKVLLVVDAMTGQEAAALVTTFNLEIGITGAILTKLDGDSRGGATLSVKEVGGGLVKMVNSIYLQISAALLTLIIIVGEERYATKTTAVISSKGSDVSDGFTWIRVHQTWYKKDMKEKIIQHGTSKM
ncbi:hypothetical protein GBA52_023988 [Prunus armeniaca]|nr:hypothetical protein GBA52_023988 [Prunus armeniaca]